MGDKIPISKTFRPSNSTLENTPICYLKLFFNYMSPLTDQWILVELYAEIFNKILGERGKKNISSDRSNTSKVDFKNLIIFWKEY